MGEEGGPLDFGSGLSLHPCNPTIHNVHIMPITLFVECRMAVYVTNDSELQKY